MKTGRRLSKTALWMPVLGLLAAAALMSGCAGVCERHVVQWPNIPGRNMVLNARHLPADIENAREVMYAKLGSKWLFAQPVVADGRIYLGASNTILKDERLAALCKPGQGAAFVCIDQATGERLWELAVPHSGYRGGSYGVCSPPVVEGDRIYVRGIDEVFCLDVHGQADGNDGPFLDELELWAQEKRVKDASAPTELLPTDADIIWRYDMADELGAQFHDAGTGTVLVQDDYVWANTSHAYGDLSPQQREAPHLIVLDKHTGRLVARDDVRVPIVFHSEWCSPSAGAVDDRTLVFWGDGYGVLHAFEVPDPAGGDEVQTLNEVWRLDCNPPGYRYLDGKPYLFADHEDMLLRYPQDVEWADARKGHGPSHFLATPVFHNGFVYIGIGRDRAHHGHPREPFGRLLCIDPRGSGDITESGVVWENRQLGRTQSTVSIVDDLLFVADIDGMLYCLDAATGRMHWQHEVDRKLTCRSQLVADGKVYAITDRGVLWVFEASEEKKMLAECDLKADKEKRRHAGQATTPTAVDGILYLATPDWIAGYALPEGTPPHPTAAYVADVAGEVQDENTSTKGIE